MYHNDIVFCMHCTKRKNRDIPLEIYLYNHAIENRIRYSTIFNEQKFIPYDVL